MRAHHVDDVLGPQALNGCEVLLEAFHARYPETDIWKAIPVSSTEDLGALAIYLAHPDTDPVGHPDDGGPAADSHRRARTARLRVAPPPDP